MSPVSCAVDYRNNGVFTSRNRPIDYYSRTSDVCCSQFRNAEVNTNYKIHDSDAYSATPVSVRNTKPITNAIAATPRLKRSMVPSCRRKDRPKITAV